jgi:hypothetical protein
MEKQIVRIFDDFEAADRAREELVAAGFIPDAVELCPQDDEAGPPQGNFTVGDAPSVAGGTDYNDTFKPREQRTPYLMVVTPADAAQAEFALGVLERYGAKDPDALVPSGQAPRPH